MGTEKQQNPATAKEIWSILRETSSMQKELTRKMAETDRQMKETDRKITEKMAETNRQMKETDQRIKETEQQLKETNRILKETEKQIKKTDALFNSQWGKLVESLVEGSLVGLLQAWGIEVMQTFSRVNVAFKKKNGDIKRREFDIIAANGGEMVAVEVKTTLKPKDVSFFLETLKDFKKYFPRHQSEKVYGAVAYLKSDAEARVFAEKKGLFVIRATGDSASLINKKGFKPKAF